MTRRVRAVLVNGLLVLLAAVSASFVVVSMHSPTSLEREERRDDLLSVFRRDDVSRLVFERSNGAFTLARADSKDPGTAAFRITAPFQEEAVPEAVDTLLSSLNFAPFVRRVSDGAVDRAGFGLDAPRLVLHVEMGDIHYRLRLGSSPPALSGDSYLEVSGEGAPNKGVFVVRRGLVDQLDVNVDKFRGRQLVPYGRSSVAALKLSDAAGSWEMRRAGGRFRLDGAAHDVWVDRDRDERLFLQLARLEVGRFLPVDAAEVALKTASPVRLEIRSSDAGSPPAQIEIGAVCAGDPSQVVALRRSPGTLAGCVSKAVATTLSGDVSDLMDLHAFSTRFDETTGIEITNQGHTLKLTRSGDGIKMEQPESGTVEGDVGEERLKGLLGLSGTLILDRTPAELGFPAHAIEVVVHATSGQEDEAVSFVLGAGARCFALRHGDGALLEIERVDPTLFDVNALLLKSRQIFDLQARDVKRVEIEGAEVKQTIVQADSGLRLESPAGFEIDSGLGFAVIDAVRSLHAVRWVTASDASQLGEPQLEVRFSVEHGGGAPEAHRLLLGANTNDGVLATVDGGGIFVLASGVIETFETWVLDRAVFLPLLPEVTRIQLRAPRGFLDLEKHGDGFRETGGSRQISNAEIQQLLDELAVTRAEAAVHLGPALAHEGFTHPTLALTAQGADGRSVLEWTIGVADAWRDVSVYYGRVLGKNATFAVPRRHIQRILDAL